MFNAYNFIAFQIGWFACVLGGAYNYPWLGTAIALAIVVGHLALLQERMSEALLIGSAAIIGAFWDSLLVALDITEFQSGMLVKNTAPVWIVTMWMLFATTLNHSMGWLRGRYMLAILFGFIGGPAAYYAGHRLGGVVFPDTLTAMATLAVSWAALTPVLLAIAGFLTARSKNQTGGNIPDATAPANGARS